MEKEVKDFEKELIATNYTDHKMYLSRTLELMLWLNDNGITSWKQVKTTDITLFFESLKAKPKKNGGIYKAETLNKYRDILKRFSAFIQSNNKGYFKMSVQKFKDEREDKYEPAVLSIDQIRILFETIGKMNVWLLSDRDRVMLHLCYSCGMRITEVVNVNIEDVYPEAGYIHLKYAYNRRIKNGKERKVILHPEVSKEIEHYLHSSRLTMLGNNPDEQALIVNSRGKRLGKQSIEDRLKAIIEASDNEELKNLHVTPHCLRHTLASHLLDEGMSIQDVQFILGHTSSDSTDRYIHLLIKKKQK
jgi:integrase/recombinase XerD